MLGLCLGLTGLIHYLRDDHVDRSILVTGGVLTLVALVCAALSGYFWNGFEYSLVLGTVTLAGGLVPRGRETNWPLVLYGVLLTIGSVVLLKLLVHYYHQVQLFGAYGLVRLPLIDFRNPNVLARFLGLVGLGLMLLAPGRRWRLTGVPFLGLLLLSASRGAVLALVAAGIAEGFRWLADSVTPRRLILVVSVVVVLLVALMIAYPTGVSRVTNLQRINLALESMRLLGDYPVTGVGGWNFGLVYPAYSLDDQWQRHPHSLILWLLTAFGIAGSLVVVAVVWWFLGGRFRWLFVPVLVFVLVHELVDTMVWIPGVLLLMVLLLLGGLESRTVRARRSAVLPLLSVLVVLSGLVVWKTDRDFKQGLRKFRAGHYREARAHWWNDLAGFTRAHRAVALAEENKLENASRQLRKTIATNAYDPFYRWLHGRLLKRFGRTEKARERFRQYSKRDPHGMLTLRKKSWQNSTGSSGTEPTGVSFLTLWLNQRKPRSYLPFVRQSLEEGRTTLAARRIEFLLGLPKLTRRTRDKLLKFRSQLPGDRTTKQAPGRGSEGLSTEEYRRFRSQFHYFFYRRPGSDYASFRTND